MRERLRNPDVIIVLLLVVLGGGGAVWFATAPVVWLQDDAYYYLLIGKHLAGGVGSTFDGVNPTNGYQPLWLGFLAALYAVWRSDQVALSGVMLLQGFFLSLTLALIYLAARIFYGRLAALVAPLLWLSFTLQEAFKGLEFSLHAFCLAALALLYLKWFRRPLPRDTRPYLLCGVVASLAFLARLDTLGLTLILAAALLLNGRHLPHLTRHLVAFLAPVASTAALYVLINLRVFGIPLPISGAIKLMWAQQLLAADPVYQSAGYFAAKLANLLWITDGFPQQRTAVYLTFGTLGAAALWLAAFLIPRSAVKDFLGRLLQPLAPFIFYSVWSWLLFGILLHLQLSWSPWYYVVQPWLVAMLAAGLWEGLARGISRRAFFPKRLWMRRAAALVLFTLALLPLLGSAQEARVRRAQISSGAIRLPLYEGAKWASANLPPAAVIGAWNAGTIGFFSEHRTVNLDGVVNSVTFAERERFSLCPYFARQGIAYLLDAFEADRALSVAPTYPAYAECAARLEPVWSDARYAAPWRVQVYHIVP